MRTKTRWIILATAGALLAAGTTAGAVCGTAAEPPQRAALTAMTNFTPGSVNLLDCPSLSLGYHGGCVNELQSELNQTENAGLTARRHVRPGNPAGAGELPAAVRTPSRRHVRPEDRHDARQPDRPRRPQHASPAELSPCLQPGRRSHWAAANAATAGGFFDKNDPCTEFTSRALNAGGLPPDPTWYPPTDGVDRYVNSGNLSAGLGQRQRLH